MFTVQLTHGVLNCNPTCAVWNYIQWCAKIIFLQMVTFSNPDNCPSIGHCRGILMEQITHWCTQHVGIQPQVHCISLMSTDLILVLSLAKANSGTSKCADAFTTSSYTYAPYIHLSAWLQWSPPYFINFGQASPCHLGGNKESMKCVHVK